MLRNLEKKCKGNAKESRESVKEMYVGKIESINSTPLSEAEVV